MKSYGITNKRETFGRVEEHLENLSIKGFSLEKSFFTPEVCNLFCEKLENVYNIQVKEFGLDLLNDIDDLDMARMPFLYDRQFFQFFTNPFILDVCKRYIGNNLQLHLQNGIINRGNKEHHQTSWHRDLPYQDWVISKPLAVNAFICLTDFTESNGATVILPYSHKLDYFPSKSYESENAIKLIAPIGSIIFFDSMMYHRASNNITNETRYGLNNMFVVPIIKQQINIPLAIGNKYELSDHEMELLGFNYQIPNDVLDFRNKRLLKKKKI